jgi:type VI secretion system protein ImpJ
MRCEPRVLWTVGQTLLPDHLRRLEDSILSHTAVRSALTELPAYGFSRIKFGNALGSDGLLTIESGVIIMRSGSLLSIGENATVNTINLNAAGKTKQKIFIHLLPPERLRPGTELLQSTELPVWKWRLILSSDEEIEGTLEYLPVAEFECDINGYWSIDEDFVPPLLLVGTPGFLRNDIDKLAKNLEKYKKSLVETLADLQLSGENLIRARRALIEVRFFLHFLLNLCSEVPMHPYELVTRLERLQLEIAAYQNQEPLEVGRIYQHMNLKACLLNPLRAVLIMLERDRESIPMAEFKLTGGVYQVDLSDACANATNWFVLIQKPSTEFQVTLAGVKIASATRLPIVHKYFLQGVTTRRIDRPLFQHYFGPEVEIWEIQKSDEWVEALNERSLAFLSEQRFSEVKCFLYWSHG